MSLGLTIYAYVCINFPMNVMNRGNIGLVRGRIGNALEIGFEGELWPEFEIAKKGMPMKKPRGTDGQTFLFDSQVERG